MYNVQSLVTPQYFPTEQFEAMAEAGCEDQIDKIRKIQQRVRSEAKQIIHHEIFHVLEASMLRKRGLAFTARKDPDFVALNPPEFKYGQEEGGFSSDIGSATQPGFTSTYGMVNEYEDRAEVYGTLFGGNRWLRSPEFKAKNNSVLLSKVSYLKALVLEHCSSELTEEGFWTTVEKHDLWEPKEVNEGMLYSF